MLGTQAKINQLKMVRSAVTAVCTAPLLNGFERHFGKLTAVRHPIGTLSQWLQALSDGVFRQNTKEVSKI